MKKKSFWLDYSRKHIWKDWLLRLPYDKRDIYYDPDYAALYTDSANVNCYIYTKKENVYLYPFIIRPIPEAKGYFDISTPYGYGGPIFNTEDTAFLNEAYRCFYKEALERNIIAEVIKFHPLLCNYLAMAGIFKGEIKRMCSTVYVDINVEEEHRWRNIYTHMNRKNINKARRSNIETRTGQDEKIWQAFKLLYKETMNANEAGRFYFFSSNYFKKIKLNLSNNYILISCSVNKRIVSAMLVLLSEAYAHCHTIGTDRRFMKTGVNNLLHHELILWCKENRYEKLHIGGGRTDDENDTLLRFKKNFSDNVSFMYVGESVLNPDIYNQLCREWSLKNPGKQDTKQLLKYRI